MHWTFPHCVLVADYKLFDCVCLKVKWNIQKQQPNQMFHDKSTNNSGVGVNPL
jgi:hypothetical protein